MTTGAAPHCSVPEGSRMIKPCAQRPTMEIRQSRVRAARKEPKVETQAFSETKPHSPCLQPAQVLITLIQAPLEALDPSATHTHQRAVLSRVRARMQFVREARHADRARATAVPSPRPHRTPSPRPCIATRTPVLRAQTIVVSGREPARPSSLFPPVRTAPPRPL